MEQNDATTDLRKAVSFSFDRQFLSQSRVNRLWACGIEGEERRECWIVQWVIRPLVLPAPAISSDKHFTGAFANWLPPRMASALDTERNASTVQSVSGILVAYRVRYVLVEPLDIINNESPSSSNGQPYLRMTEKNVTRLHFQTTAGEHLFGVKYEFRVAAVSNTGIGPEVSDRIAVPEAVFPATDGKLICGAQMSSLDHTSMVTLDCGDFTCFNLRDRFQYSHGVSSLIAQRSQSRRFAVIIAVYLASEKVFSGSSKVSAFVTQSAGSDYLESVQLQPVHMEPGGGSWTPKCLHGYKKTIPAHTNRFPAVQPSTKRQPCRKIRTRFCTH
ncbi:receptor tyrosine phosphatase type r2a [Clonorchis sinensis]|uniref:Receptor tyrosine phosphatase type r2a n=1 Tax=Clonorchis sinensis TaxID=79923 RepID=G7YP08_CLOSI|nr:receptor tyrosine phosphatase type r2a [Clonorchis sinensis]